MNDDSDQHARVNQMARSTTVLVGGVETVRHSRSEMTDLMIEDCEKARSSAVATRLIFDLNGHAVALSRWDSNFRRNLASADIVHADGQAIVLASKLLTDSPIAERSATTDLFLDAAEIAVQRGLRFYLLGGSEDVNRRCADTMRANYPGLKIVGRRNGFFTNAEEAEVCSEISRLDIDVLWVGLGKPKEQSFCVRNKHQLKVGWAVTCGGCFNFVVGEYARAPNWMQNTGLEWAHRLIMRPRQLLWRYLTTNPVALYTLLTRTRTIAGGMNS